MRLVPRDLVTRPSSTSTLRRRVQYLGVSWQNDKTIRQTTDSVSSHPSWAGGPLPSALLRPAHQGSQRSLRSAGWTTAGRRCGPLGQPGCARPSGGNGPSRRSAALSRSRPGRRLPSPARCRRFRLGRQLLQQARGLLAVTVSEQVDRGEAVQPPLSGRRRTGATSSRPR